MPTMYRRCLRTVSFLMFASSVALLIPAADAQHDDQKQHQHTNALANESSPYLLLHAHNPVDWYPWNDQTLAKAKAESKPIFLSVGYSSCHWCHVMERESFLDEEIAKFLNENFICIKVDREERPDVDEIYMESLNVFNQMMRTGRGGGWPLSMFLTPDTRPFFGGTYFPARDGDREGSPGFLGVIKKLDNAWKTNQDGIQASAKVLTEVTQQQLSGGDKELPTAIQSRWVSDALESLTESYDEQFGGFGFSATRPNRPKFPEASNLMFLSYLATGGDESAKAMLENTCQRMLMGGIYDHVGGGFHRYSVDRFWAIPHFEKMLYDNGQLATVYSQMYQLTKSPEYKWAVEGILRSVSRDLMSPEGAFFSSLDAESEGEEGKYYRWEKSEFQETLTEGEFKFYAGVYGINDAPNFENEYYAPQWKLPFKSTATDATLSVEQFLEKVAPLNAKLLNVRQKRIAPATDEKILTEWNGMMIRGFADAGRILENESYVQTAEKAADFVLKSLRDENGRLYRTYTSGQAQLNGYLTDYANLIDGLIAIHRANGQQRWLEEAVALQKVQDQWFEDTEKGGYFYTASDHQTLLFRTKRAIDGAVPSGNSVSAQNLIYLAEAAELPELREKAKRVVLSAGNLIDQVPTAAPRMSIAADLLKKE
jgi:uncharacterized protein YyaL (SSP411 family)